MVRIVVSTVSSVQPVTAVMVAGGIGLSRAYEEVPKYCGCGHNRICKHLYANQREHLTRVLRHTKETTVGGDPGPPLQQTYFSIGYFHTRLVGPDSRGEDRKEFIHRRKKAKNRNRRSLR